MHTKFFTNKENNSLIKKFEGVFQYQDIAFFDALVGYFRASGYFKLRPFLENVPQIRILVGIHADTLIAQAKQRGQLYLENPEQTKEEYLNFVAKDIAAANYDKQTEGSILQFIEDIISQKIQIRAYGQQKLHAKIYIFRPNPFNEHTSGSVITGSSNLTDSGLGTYDEANYEFNVLLKDYNDVKFATDEFEELWENSTPLLPTDIQQLKAKTYLGDGSITPYDVFMKMLVEYFGDAIIRGDVGKNYLPEGYTNLKYQADAVADGFQRLMKHNGFILADVVGLGKTVIATRIIKKYIDKNGHNTKVLVVYPNALEIGWKSTIKDFGLSNYVDFISNGSLNKVLDEQNFNYQPPEFYDLIIIDEAHKFRNSNSAMYSYLELICKTPRANLGNDVDRRKKVMLITATPINNRPEDIANQIYLFQDARKSTIEGVPNLQSFFADKIEKYKELYKITDHNELVKAVRDIYEPIREKIFSELVIRRTRADIKKIPRYNEDIAAQGMTFPQIVGPNKVEYEFSPYQEQVFYDTVIALLSNLKYFRYRAIEFLNEEFADIYDNAKLISEQLASIMKTQLVKRLESSFKAFHTSLQRFYLSNQRMIEMFEKDKVYIAPDIDVNKFLNEGKEQELEEKIEKLAKKSPNNRIFKATDFSEELLIGLKSDQEILTQLVEAWKNIGDDPKTKKFLHSIENLFFDKKNIEKKLVIFSESKDTVEYLLQELKKVGRKDVLAISSENNKKEFDAIRENFDANYPKKQENKYNIIITTEVLAEGINLHRSNIILNYDIPWNATKLMQRIGRVNRIGTKADKIYVYNFYPTSQANKLIKLNEIALKKLQGFHSAFGEDSKIYSENEQLIENTLANLNVEEEFDERLLYLEMIRELYEKNPKEFLRIKKLPLKSRVGRLASIKNKEAEKIVGNGLENAILCYLRNNMKEGFYVANHKNCVEITFYQAIKLFEATQEEKAEKVYENHFDAVNKAIAQFKKVYNQIYSTEEVDKKNLSPQEREAVRFLEGLIEMRKQYPGELSDDFIEMIRSSLQLIYMGVFRKFRKELATLAKKQKSRAKKMTVQQVVNELNILMSKYPIAQITKLNSLRKEEAKKPKIFEDPKIVITETFL
ncbi:helicase-related protein [Capnocytophaga canis]|uniref:Helicase protein n=1 Tax=Capnocytophaga canis TaxID=1848903 RepID=A0A0B7ICY3_9FLAO|nr:helicase-related protein [Capnocytophaga canis]CEN49610.1 Helicase protein [Capnocytophaga canis]